MALLFCFGLALITGLFGLSSALGAFLAGVLITSSGQTAWIHSALAPFRVVFVGAFFVSVGLLIDLEFLAQEWPTMVGLVAAVLLTNTFINALVLHGLGDSWRDSLYAGALLAQVGELSFVLAAVGLQAGIIERFAYEATVGTIAITLSPAWIFTWGRITGWSARPHKAG